MIIVMQKEEMKMKKIKMRRERNLEVRDDFEFTQKKKKQGSQRLRNCCGGTSRHAMDIYAQVGSK